VPDIPQLMVWGTGLLREEVQFGVAVASLQQMIAAHIEAAGLQQAPRDAPHFRAALGRAGKLAATAIHVNDIFEEVQHLAGHACDDGDAERGRGSVQQRDRDRVDGH